MFDFHSGRQLASWGSILGLAVYGVSEAAAFSWLPSERDRVSAQGTDLSFRDYIQQPNRSVRVTFKLDIPSLSGWLIKDKQVVVTDTGPAMHGEASVSLLDALKFLPKPASSEDPVDPQTGIYERGDGRLAKFQALGDAILLRFKPVEMEPDPDPDPLVENLDLGRCMIDGFRLTRADAGCLRFITEYGGVDEEIRVGDPISKLLKVFPPKVTVNDGISAANATWPTDKRVSGQLGNVVTYFRRQLAFRAMYGSTANPIEQIEFLCMPHQFRIHD